MTYPASFEEKLGFDLIRKRLNDYCLSEAGRMQVAAMGMETNPATIRTRLQQTLELRLIYDKGEEFPSRHYFDGEDWLKKIALEGNYLDPDEFLHLSQSLET